MEPEKFKAGLRVPGLQVFVGWSPLSPLGCPREGPGVGAVDWGGGVGAVRGWKGDARLQRVLELHPSHPGQQRMAGRAGVGVPSDGDTNPRLAPWLPGKPAEAGPTPVETYDGGRILAGPGAGRGHGWLRGEVVR